MRSGVEALALRFKALAQETPFKQPIALIRLNPAQNLAPFSFLFPTTHSFLLYFLRGFGRVCRGYVRVGGNGEATVVSVLIGEARNCIGEAPELPAWTVSTR